MERIDEHHRRSGSFWAYVLINIGIPKNHYDYGIPCPADRYRHCGVHQAVLNRQKYRFYR